MNWTRLAIVASLGAATIVVGQANPTVAKKPPQYFVDESKLAFDPIAGIESEQIWGVHKGAGYRMEVPADWNGDLVVWAHGFRGEGLELTVDNGPIRQYLLENGYAWAASSYSKNAYDVSVGVKDTHAVTMLFNSKVGNRPQQAHWQGYTYDQPAG